MFLAGHSERSEESRTYATDILQLLVCHGCDWEMFRFAQHDKHFKLPG